MVPSPNGFPTKLDRSRPLYSIHAFDQGLSTSSYSNYSDSITGISEHGYAHQLESSPTSQESLGARVFHTLSDAVKKNPGNLSGLSRAASVHTRSLSLAEQSGAMLARTTSIRLSGLLSRPTTQKPANDRSEEGEDDMSEPEDMPEYKTTFSGSCDPSSREATPRRHERTLSRPSTATQPKGRFAWFSTPKQETPRQAPRPSTAAPLSASLELSDPLLQLNIDASLFPFGPQDPHDPASFNDLLHNSVSLCERLLKGYREKSNLLKQSHSERDLASEEADEARIRVAHLKSQLETLAAKANERERAMKDLATQLSREREQRVEEAAELEKLRAWKRQAEQDRHDSMMDPTKSPPRPFHGGDDDPTPRRRVPGSPRKERRSDGLNSDSGFESDGESVSYSIDTASTVSGPVTPGPVYMANMDGGHWNKGVVVDRGIGTKPTGNAGGVIGDLQRENMKLRHRVVELERAVDGCLDLV